MMHEQGKSDRPIVPGTPANQPDASGSAKRNDWAIWEQWARVEYADKGKGLAEEKAEFRWFRHGHRTQRRVRGASAASEALSQALDRIRQAARRDKGLKFTSLWHHVYAVDRLREACLGLARQAAPGGRGKSTGKTWKRTCGICRSGWREAPTEPGRSSGCTFPKRMAESGPFLWFRHG